MTTEDIEKLIDDKELVYILTSLELITQEKADLMDDKALAKRYKSFSKAIYKIMSEYIDII